MRAATGSQWSSMSSGLSLGCHVSRTPDPPATISPTTSLLGQPCSCSPAPPPRLHVLPSTEWHEPRNTHDTDRWKIHKSKTTTTTITTQTQITQKHTRCKPERQTPSLRTFLQALLPHTYTHTHTHTHN